MPHFVPASGFTQQIEEFTKQLAALADGPIEVNERRDGANWHTSYYVEIPDSASGVTTTFDYREEFRRVMGGWLRSAYAYELRLSEPRGNSQHSRRAHHDHGSIGIHQHCQSPGSPENVHYADVERLLQATHEAFVRQFASATPIDCSGLVRTS